MRCRCGAHRLCTSENIGLLYIHITAPNVMQVGWFSVLSFASSERYLRVDAVSSDTLVKEDFILWVQHEARCHNHVNDDSRSFKVLLLRRLLNY